MKHLLNFCSLLSALCFLPACASTPIFDAVPEVVTVTNRVRVVEVLTNTIAVPAVIRDTTTGATQIVTNLVAVPVFITNTVAVTELVTNTIYTVSEQVLGHAATVRAIGNTIATVSPPAAPFVSAANAFMALGIGLLGLFAKAKTTLAAKHKTALDKTGTILRTVVAGVEAANNSTVKTLIAQHASAADIAHELDSVVQTVSTTMSRAPKPAH